MQNHKSIQTKHGNVSGCDEIYGECKMLIQSKKITPILYLLLSVLFIIIVWYNYATDNMSFTFAILTSLLCIGIAGLELSYMLDKIEVFEYGCISHTLFHQRHRRFAYDDIESILAMKVRKKQMAVSTWQIYIHDQKRIVLDPSSYIGLSEFMNALKEEAKIDIQNS